MTEGSEKSAETADDKPGIRRLLGALAFGALVATAVASWWYPNSAFGKFSQTIGFAGAGAIFGWWAADYYYWKDAYKKRYRDVEISVYTTWLLIAGVEAIQGHIGKARTSLLSMKPKNDDEHSSKLLTYSDIQAGHTAAQLTLSMSYMALANLETFSKDAVESGKKKFASNEQEAGTRQQLKEVLNATSTPATVGGNSSVDTEKDGNPGA